MIDLKKIQNWLTTLPQDGWYIETSGLRRKHDNSLTTCPITSKYGDVPGMYDVYYELEGLTENEAECVAEAADIPFGMDHAFEESRKIRCMMLKQFNLEEEDV